MKIYRGLPRPDERLPVALTIGNFDGVHRGHQALLAGVVAAARARRLVPAVMTFEPHPREFFTPEQAPARVANLRDKLESLRTRGIERVFIEHFNRRFASTSAQEFIEKILIERCCTRWLAVGDDFRFGARRTGDVTMLRDYAQRGAFELAQVPTVTEDGERISSSAVRAALAAGDLARAGRLLGHAYFVSGRVQHGAKLGRTLGFPTLNLRIAHVRRQRQPAVHGIFAVRVSGIKAAPLPGVASVGMRPTLDDSGRWLLEVHLFDFAEQIYGKLVRVEFLQKLRDEEKFASLDQLTAAIRSDAERARALLAGAM
jgi:riboflavin kinase/FMN adenylyltransferase